ncbi:hypothetical protein D3C76_914830 [compost metagenome]
MLCAAHDNIWLNTDTTEFFYTMLSRFSFHFTCSFNVWNERYMNIHHILTTDVALDLTNGFQERQALDITDSSANFRNNYIRTRFTASAEDTLFNFVRDMRNNLYRSAQIFTAAFFANNG